MVKISSDDHGWMFRVIFPWWEIVTIMILIAGLIYFVRKRRKRKLPE